MNIFIVIVIFMFMVGSMSIAGLIGVHHENYTVRRWAKFIYLLLYTFTLFAVVALLELDY